ncbi:MAG: bifunctional nuclease domain-containing protein [Armatimonadota bacterium]
MHAFGELVSRYQGLIYGLAYHQIRNYTDAQDITQNVFVHVFKSINQLEQPDRLVPWLRVITANECKMWLRSKQRHISIDDIDTDPSIVSLIDTRHREHERLAEIRRIIDSLPEKSRLVITLYYLSGLSCREIGEYMGIPANTATQHLYRARRQLKDLLSNVEEDYTMNKLPESFTSEVLQIVLLYPVTEGQFLTATGENGYQGFMMRVGERNSDNPFITVWMKQDDLNDILLGLDPNRTSENAKGRALSSALQILDTFGIKLRRVVLRLSDDRKCIACVDLVQGETKFAIDMRPSDAIGLAVRVKVPIFTDDAVIKQGNVGEDDAPVPDYLIDSAAYNLEFRKQQQHEKLRDKAFEMGLSPETLIDTVRFHKDESEGKIIMWIEAYPDNKCIFDLDEYRLGIDMIYDMAHQKGSAGLVHGDMVRGWNKRTRFYFSMLETDARMRVVVEDIDTPPECVMAEWKEKYDKVGECSQ